MSVGPTVEIDGKTLCDWDSFHRTFAKTFGFFDGYGRNMNAWIDCMGCMREDNPEQRLSEYHVPKDATLTIRLKNVEVVRNAEAGMLHELLDCSAFVNGRELDRGDAQLLAIAY